MDGGILNNLPAIIMHELVAKRGNIDGKRQGENNGDSPPRGKLKSGGVIRTGSIYACHWFGGMCLRIDLVHHSV
jgi:hypothetical protein